MVRSVATSVLAVALLLALCWGDVQAQSSLGGQRIATSSATFLKIGVDARAVALGGAYTAVAQGPLAAFYNPAGIAETEQLEVGFGYARWPAEIGLYAVSTVYPIGQSGTSFGVALEYLGTTLDETTAYYPQGTGRSFTYSDFTLGFSAAKPITDRLSVGGTIKFIHEDLGSAIGGPTINGWLADAGTLYHIGALNGRLAISLLHFGSDLKPEGSFQSYVTGEEVNYAAFSPPTLFRVGVSLTAHERGKHRIDTMSDVSHLSDNQETIRGGIEYRYNDRYFLRTGYDTGADVARFSAGFGLRFPWKLSHLQIDYAYTDGGPLLAIHRWSVVLPI